ncbi:unnamed protein product [Ectocarpus sp. 4 AP-2014]|uniref:EsV-1-203 n=1 Tax=Ectocarpus siliculosus virus 1 (isolate New Zealand/Kaikoura/1988) TaxID=654926 RepID=Q8QN86_ESV1K|nr:EsV-1-203 [Ectocarpus siliculosus virus 1]AAK14617.1 EsV-1-203 [Ectocarpus siliculosus virus 1]
MHPVAGAIALDHSTCAVMMCCQHPVQVVLSKSTLREGFLVCANHSRDIREWLDSKGNAGACTTSHVRKRRQHRCNVKSTAPKITRLFLFHSTTCTRHGEH